MSHPAGCHDPACTLTYREHLLTVGIATAALPTRAVTRTEGQPDEPSFQTAARQRRFDRDIPSYKRLTEAGAILPSVDGAACRERLVNDGMSLDRASEIPIMIDFYDRGPKPITSTQEGVTPP